DQSVDIPDRNGFAAVGVTKYGRYLSSDIAYIERGATRRGDPVELARHHQPFERRLPSHQMQVCHAEAVTESRTGLIGLQDHMRQPVCGDLLLDPPKMVSAADEQKHDIRPGAQGAGSFHYSLEVVATAQIAGIGDDKFSSEIPALPQGIRLGRYGLDGASV